MSEYPKTVTISVDRTGLAPRELKLVRKVSGASFDDLDTESKLQAAGFIALLRLFPDDDPGVLWEQADNTLVKPPDGVIENPPDGPANGGG
jgi:hypothetical protein